MSLPAREPPPSADASLPLRFDDSDRDLLARAFGSPGDGPRAWRLNGEAHRISLVDGFDRLLAWPVLHGVTRYDHQERTALRVLRDLRGRAILADEVGLGKTIEAGLGLKEDSAPGLIHPVQNDMDELFTLVPLLKPGQLHTSDRFLERYVASPDRRVPMRVSELRGRLRDVMVRNRRGIAFTLPPRRVHSLAVRLSPAERHLYDDVTAFVRDAYWSASGRLPWTARLTLIVLQREIGSSTFAVAETLRRLAQSPLFRSDERERLEALREDAAAIASNVKAGRLREFLKSADEKVLIFTQYLRTLQYLEGVLEADGHRIAAYHGGLSPAAKAPAVRTFRADAYIFLSTEAGGEGRNLPFARTLVSYDLQSIPVRIEHPTR